MNFICFVYCFSFAPVVVKCFDMISLWRRRCVTKCHPDTKTHQIENTLIHSFYVVQKSMFAFSPFFVFNLFNWFRSRPSVLPIFNCTSSIHIKNGFPSKSDRSIDWNWFVVFARKWEINTFKFWCLSLLDILWPMKWASLYWHDTRMSQDLSRIITILYLFVDIMSSVSTC